MGEQFEFDAISNTLGMEKSALASQADGGGGILSLITSIDWRYQMWKVGITMTDNPFLYQLGYFLFSVLGNYNYFFFAAHLLDVAVGVAALKIILQAITHNGKELVLTLMLLTIIVYIYTVIAFNFFRQFYVSGEDEEESKMCHDMLTCFVFKDYLDSVPHGFDIHVQKEHNLANYLFFLMYLIGKDPTEYTGQETYVWDMYKQRCWDFFPAGDCFRKQYESELEGGGGG